MSIGSKNLPFEAKIFNKLIEIKPIDYGNITRGALFLGLSCIIITIMIISIEGECFMLKKCKRCGAEWKTRMVGNPVQCPRCKRVDWNKEKGKSQTKMGEL